MQIKDLERDKDRERKYCAARISLWRVQEEGEEDRMCLVYPFPFG
jgi:hypothetical protein